MPPYDKTPYIWLYHFWGWSDYTDAVRKVSVIIFQYLDADLLFWQVVMVTAVACPRMDSYFGSYLHGWPLLATFCHYRVDVYGCCWTFLPLVLTWIDTLFTQSREIFYRYCSCMAVNSRTCSVMSYLLPDLPLFGHPLHHCEECLVWEEAE